MTLQDKITTTKRTHILNAAARTFTEKGYHVTTVRDVARAAGVADGTIYNHFQNKYALLLGLFTQMTEAAEPALNPAALTGLHLRELLREMLDQPLQSLRGENYELVRVVLSEALINRDLASDFRTGLLTPMLAGTVEVLRRRGDLRADPEDTVRLLSSLVLGLLLQAALGDEELQETWAVLPDRLADLLVGGLA